MGRATRTHKEVSEENDSQIIHKERLLMSRITLSRSKWRLREGINLEWDGREFILQPKWGLIAEEVIPISVLNPENEGALLAEFSASGQDSLNMSSDPRILLLALRYLLFVTGEREDNFRKIENDKVKARSQFEELYDQYANVIVEGYA